MNDRVRSGPGVSRGLLDSFRTCLANSGLSCITNLPSGNSKTWIGLSDLEYLSAIVRTIDLIFSSERAPIMDPIVLMSRGLPETYSAASQRCWCAPPGLDVGSD